MPSDPLLVITKVARAFDRLGVPYLVGGSVASSIYGVPRLTRDVDFVADIREEDVPALAALWEGEFHLDTDLIRDAVRARDSFNILHLDTMFKADVFLMKRDAWAREEMARRRQERIDSEDVEGGEVIQVASPEDVVLQKLAWFRLGGGVSERQWNDVVEVLRVQAGALDLDYLRRWADELALAPLLTQALAEAG